MAEIKNMAARMPPITAELVMLTTGLQTQRKIFGAVWCRDRSIGAMRRKLGKVTENGHDSAAQLDIARDQARVMLSELCRECPNKHCKMRDW